MQGRCGEPSRTDTLIENWRTMAIDSGSTETRLDANTIPRCFALGVLRAQLMGRMGPPLAFTFRRPASSLPLEQQSLLRPAAEGESATAEHSARPAPTGPGAGREPLLLLLPSSHPSVARLQGKIIQREEAGPDSAQGSKAACAPRSVLYHQQQQHVPPKRSKRPAIAAKGRNKETERTPFASSASLAKEREIAAAGGGRSSSCRCPSHPTSRPTPFVREERGVLRFLARCRSATPTLPFLALVGDSSTLRAMHATARKRQKLDRKAPSDGNLVEALSRLRAQAAFFAAPGTDAGELQREVSTLNQRIAAFEDALAQAEAGEVDRLIGRGWKDELDGTGTRLWNQSTALKLAQDDGQEQRAKLGVVASRALDLFAPHETKLTSLDFSPPRWLSPDPPRCS